MGIACAVNRYSGHRQSGSSPRAGSKCPRPGGGVGLDIAEDPCRDCRGEENRVDERSWDEVKTPPYLGDGDVAASSSLSAVTLAFLRGDGLSHGGWWWYGFKRHHAKGLKATHYIISAQCSLSHPHFNKSSTTCFGRLAGPSPF